MQQLILGTGTAFGWQSLISHAFEQNMGKPGPSSPQNVPSQILIEEKTSILTSIAGLNQHQ
jgi:hypothetical protein